MKSDNDDANIYEYSKNNLIANNHIAVFSENKLYKKTFAKKLNI
jgi:hypothetical protein